MSALTGSGSPEFTCFLTESLDRESASELNNIRECYSVWKRWETLLCMEVVGLIVWVSGSFISPSVSLEEPLKNLKNPRDQLNNKNEKKDFTT